MTVFLIAIDFILVPRAGLEPAFFAEEDFETSAYTNSATEAYASMIGKTEGKSKG